MWVLWILLGLVIGFVCAAPVLRVMLHRAERRAREAERRALDSERMAELGSMTAGLAHEIKNPLSTVGLNAQLLAEGINDARMPDDERERLLRRLDSLSREAERLRAILTDFLQFAGRVKLDARPRDLVRIITDLRDFFHPQCDQNRIVLRTKLPEQPVAVQVDGYVWKDPAGFVRLAREMAQVWGGVGRRPGYDETENWYSTSR